jgi:hypothetical protein
MGRLDIVRGQYPVDVVEGYAVKWQEGALAILLQNNYSNWQI